MQIPASTAHVTGALAGFVDFIRKQGVIGLAIGFVLGSAVAKVVAALVSDLITPVIGLLLGSAKGLEEVVLGPFKIGHFLSVALDAAIIAAVVYFFVVGLGLDKMDHAEGGSEAAKDELKDQMKETAGARGGKSEEELAAAPKALE